MTEGTPAVEPISSADLVELATDVGPVPMNVAVALGLGPIPGGTDALAAEIGRRLAAVPRLRQRLVMRSWGRRPFWLHDAAFDVARHVSLEPVDPAAPDPVLHAAARLVTSPLPTDRPLWRAALLTQTDAVVGVVVVMHHVVADGIGGLALLAEMVDGATHEPAPLAAAPHDASLHAAGPSPNHGPAPPSPGRTASSPTHGPASPSRGRTASSPTHGPASPSAGGNASLPTTPTARLAALRRARAELGVGRLAPRSSLNAPTGPERRFTRVEIGLAALRDAARRNGATVNDALLVAITGAMARLINARGELPPSALVVSVPISARDTTTRDDLGNRVGVMPVRVPLDGPPGARLARVAEQTRVRKAGTRGASAALVGPLFRVLAALGVFRWFVDRQRLVNSFLTNLRGPSKPLTLAGTPILRIVPLTITAGNVGVAFAAFSYADALGVTLISDPGVVPDAERLASFLEEELGAVCDA